MTTVVIWLVGALFLVSAIYGFLRLMGDAIDGWAAFMDERRKRKMQLQRRMYLPHIPKDAPWSK